MRFIRSFHHFPFENACIHSSQRFVDSFVQRHQCTPSRQPEAHATMTIYAALLRSAGREEASKASSLSNDFYVEVTRGD
jgi:hypothetical protein